MWFWLAFISSLFGAFDVIISKKVLNKVSAAVLSWSMFALTLPILIYLSLREGIPSVNTLFLIGTIGSSLMFVSSKLITNNIIKKNFISKILPLTSFSGFFTYIFGLIFLSEKIRIVPLLGLLLILFGAYILNADKAKESLLKPFKLLFLRKESIFFIFAVMLVSLTAILDKTAIGNTIPNSPIFTILVEQTIMSIILGFYLFRRENKTYKIEIKNNFGMLFLNSLAFLASGMLVFYAYSMDGPAALVMGIRRLQLFFILLMGYLFFKDKPTKHIWIATAIMIMGVLMIKIG